MAIFGMNGLIALALHFGLVFAVYGQKEVALTEKQVGSIERVVQRKAIAAGTGSKEEKHKMAQEARAIILRRTRSKVTPEQAKVFGERTWLR